MKCADVMTKDPVTCNAEQTAAEAARVMWDRDCGVVPVVEGDRLVGVVTDRDLLMAAQIQGKDLRQLRISALLPGPATTCREDETIEAVLDAMASRQIRRVPVVGAEGRLVGIVSLNDVAIRAAGNDRLSKRVATTLAAICRHRDPVESSL